MNKAFLYFLPGTLLAVLVMACQPKPPDTPTLETLIADYWARQLATRPQLSLKYDQPLSEIRPFSEKTNQQDADFADKLLDQLHALDTAGLSHEDQLSYLLLKKKQQICWSLRVSFTCSFP